MAHLKVVRTAIGVLLNASMGYGALLPFLDDRQDALTNACSNPEPVKTALNTVEAPVAILRLAGVIYPAGAWAKCPAPHIPPEECDESWQLRSGLSSWAWRAIGELKYNGARCGASI